MAEPFVHEALLTMDPDADVQAPGAAITVALCGHWSHEPPCPLAPHHTRTERRGDQVSLRTVFAAELAREAAVRQRIDRALADGHLVGEGAVRSRWRLDASGPGEVTADDATQAAGFARA